MLITKDDETPNVVRIKQDERGPRVVVFSGVHGDEVSGIHAVEKLFFDLFSGARVLERGQLTLVRANEAAMAAERRYVRHNLNRLFKEDYGAEIDRTSYEFTRAQQLKSLLHGCDFFLDLHSAPTAEEPFIVVEQGNLEFFSDLGIPRLMTGWSKFSGGAIGGTPKTTPTPTAPNRQRSSPAAISTSAQTTLRTKPSLRFSRNWRCLPGRDENVASMPLEIVEVYGVVTKDFADFRYARQAENFQFIKRGEAFAFQDGGPMTVDRGHICAHSDEAGGNQDSRGSVLFGPKGRRRSTGLVGRPVWSRQRRCRRCRDQRDAEAWLHRRRWPMRCQRR